MIYLFIILAELLTACPWDMAAENGICMDRYEAPNIYGMKPWVMQAATSAEVLCRAWDKRLCTESEWRAACELTSEPCHNNEQWKPWDRSTANSPREVERLWQGTPSGSVETCRTPAGVYDLIGNVEEWVISEKKKGWSHVLKGGWWASKFTCKRINDEHEPKFQFYQTGFRCCRDQFDVIDFLNKIFRP